MNTKSRQHRIDDSQGTTATCPPVLRSCLEPGWPNSSGPHGAELRQVQQLLEGERKPDALPIVHTYRAGPFMTGIIIVIW